MSVIADNPVLKREMRRRLRIRFAGRPWMYGVVVMAAVVIWYYVVGIAAICNDSSDDAQVWWYVTTYAMLIVACLFAPTGAARSISQERERQTWEALTLTRLSATQVLLGKWFAQFAAVAWFPVAAMPLAVAAGLRGNVGGWATVCVFGYILLNCAFFVGIGLICSFRATRSPAATATALLLAAAICLGTVLIDGMIAWSASLLQSGGIGSFVFALNINPFYALMCVDRLARGQYVAGLENGLPYSQRIYDSETVLLSVGFELAFIVVSFLWMANRYGKPDVR
jgi:ABC-type transport system involved in multi-copper enzyme maturation permease subunit